jgi:hypothetical protein
MPPDPTAEVFAWIDKTDLSDPSPPSLRVVRLADGSVAVTVHETALYSRVVLPREQAVALLEALAAALMP